jgi:hypothetical protein
LNQRQQQPSAADAVKRITIRQQQHEQSRRSLQQQSYSIEKRRHVAFHNDLVDMFLQHKPLFHHVPQLLHVQLEKTEAICDHQTKAAVVVLDELARVEQSERFFSVRAASGRSSDGVCQVAHRQELTEACEGSKQQKRAIEEKVWAGMHIGCARLQTAEARTDLSSSRVPIPPDMAMALQAKCGQADSGAACKAMIRETAVNT